MPPYLTSHHVRTGGCGAHGANPLRLLNNDLRPVPRSRGPGSTNPRANLSAAAAAPAAKRAGRRQAAGGGLPPGSESRGRASGDFPKLNRCARAAVLPADADFLQASGIGSGCHRRVEARFPYRFIGTKDTIPAGAPG